VVAPRIERIAKLVRDGTDGILYDGADPDGLANTLERLADPTLRRRIGTAARAHAVREFSWEAHCRGLQDAIQAARDRMTCAS
jgi:glycosyltransferase involved in cell wall biosynthesis